MKLSDAHLPVHRTCVLCSYAVCSFRGNAQRQASSWRGNVITLLLLTGVTGLVSWVFFTWTDDLTHTLVSRSEILTQPRVFTVECSEDYKKYKLFPGMQEVIHPFIEVHSLNTAVYIGNYSYVFCSDFFSF